MAERNIGDVIRRAREKKGLKVTEAAALCNVTRSRYYQWEDASHILGKNIPPLAKALGLSERYLRRINGGISGGRPGGTQRKGRVPLAQEEVNWSHPAKNGSL